MLHSRKRMDGETVNKLVGNTEFPQFEEPPVLQKELGDSQNKENELEKREMLEALDKKYIDIYDAIPPGKGAELTELCALGYDSRTVMSVLTTLELKGLIKLLPGGSYGRN